MEIKIRNKNGIILQTKDKICDDNIIIRLDNSLIPSGNIDITNTEEVDVTRYARAQIKDENLKAENIAENVEVLGITGTFRGGIDTYDATAEEGDLLLGKTAYANSGKITGTIETYTYDIDGEFSSEVEDFFMNRIETYYNDRITELPNYAFCGKLMKKIELPNVTKVGLNAFAQCSEVTELILPNLKIMGGTSFIYLTSLEKLYLPKVEVTGSQCFMSCTNLKYVLFDSLTQFADYTFQSCKNITKVIIRQSNSVVKHPGSSLFYDYTFTGTVYVPDELLESEYDEQGNLIKQGYRDATNWSELASQIKPLSEWDGEF